MNKLTCKQWLGMLLSLFFLAACSQQANDGVQAFDLKKIADRHSEKIRVSESDAFGDKALMISPEEGNEGIVIWEKGDKQNWANADYLVFEIYGKNEFSGVINIEFYKEVKDFAAEKIVLQSGEISGTEKDQPWISSLMGILPHLKTKVVFPLSYLDAQNLFVPRSPRQLKGTVSGNRLDPADITKVVLRFGPYYEPHFLPEYEIASIAITKEVPEPYPVTEPAVDKLGQRNDKDWPGKLKGEEDLIARNLQLLEEVKNVKSPADWSQYGGWKAKRFGATGFFRTHHDGKRWWLVDPEGYAFLSTGVDCINAGSGGPITGIEDLFEWLPEANDPVFGEAIRSGRNQNQKSMDFYVANLIRSYGKDWREKWTTVTTGLMKKFRFNTVANWSSIDFARESKIPYVLQLGRFPSTEVKVYRDFPDVFSDEYRKNSVTFAEQLNSYKDDPFMVGYFLRNEPQWAFGYHNLAYEMFGTNQPSKTKDEFIKWLAGKYQQDIMSLNKVWELKLKAFDDLKTMTFKEYPSKVADKDFYEFSTIMVKMYVDIPCDEVDKVDKNHLNLGMRYAWLSSDMLYKAGERFDVFSINGYGINPPPTEEIARISGKPIIIGEFHHGAVDRALPATGIIGVLNQKDRAAAFRNYIEQGFARPELVGMHYFQWVDQPYYGRNDGENYNIGVVTTGNVPYPELTEAMTTTNERIYQVASGAVEPYKADMTRIPPIHY
ncbi:hypothetical protein LJB97_01620 [Parabacteroides sp. OttesenSCG-928-O15]|nr:hypothetical protein [Parabacteroides sp. OttesenSCG-928-O15]